MKFQRLFLAFGFGLMALSPSFAENAYRVSINYASPRDQLPNGSGMFCSETSRQNPRMIPAKNIVELIQNLKTRINTKDVGKNASITCKDDPDSSVDEKSFLVADPVIESINVEISKLAVAPRDSSRDCVVGASSYEGRKWDETRSCETLLSKSTYFSLSYLVKDSKDVNKPTIEQQKTLDAATAIEALQETTQIVGSSLDASQVFEYATHTGIDGDLEYFKVQYPSPIVQSGMLIVDSKGYGRWFICGKNAGKAVPDCSKLF